MALLELGKHTDNRSGLRHSYACDRQHGPRQACRKIFLWLRLLALRHGGQMPPQCKEDIIPSFIPFLWKRVALSRQPFCLGEGFGWRARIDGPSSVLSSLSGKTGGDSGDKPRFCPSSPVLSSLLVKTGDQTEDENVRYEQTLRPRNIDKGKYRDIIHMNSCSYVQLFRRSL